MLTMAVLAGCATRPTTEPTHPLGQPCNDCVAGVDNFSKVNDKLWRGAQPEGADAFRRLGAKTVINLRYEHDDFPALAGTDISYVHIPMVGAYPREEEIVLFVAALRRAMADPRHTPAEHRADIRAKLDRSP